MTVAESPLPLRDTIATKIRHLVVEGRLLPGQRLSEANYAEQMGISRNTLRETFRILTQEGLLTHIPHRGVFVTRPDLAAILDIYRVRRIIECQALADAYPHHRGMEAMEEAVSTARNAREAGDWITVGTANIAYHRAIVSLTDSPRIEAIYEQLSAELRLAFGLIPDPARMHAPYIERNADILALVKQGASQQAVEQLKAYLQQSERSLLAVYKG